jgi:hypothetical protein
MNEFLSSADNIVFWPTRVFNVISCIVVWMLALFGNYLRNNFGSFSFSGWWQADRNRFIAGFVVTLGIVLLKATSPTVDILLKDLGFEVKESSGVAYGLAIAAFLLALGGKRTNDRHANGSKE